MHGMVEMIRVSLAKSSEDTRSCLVRNANSVHNGSVPLVGVNTQLEQQLYMCVQGRVKDERLDWSIGWWKQRHRGMEDLPCKCWTDNQRPEHMH